MLVTIAVVPRGELSYQGPLPVGGKGKIQTQLCPKVPNFPSLPQNNNSTDNDNNDNWNSNNARINHPFW